MAIDNKRKKNPYGFVPPPPPTIAYAPGLMPPGAPQLAQSLMTPQVAPVPAAVAPQPQQSAPQGFNVPQLMQMHQLLQQLAPDPNDLEALHSTQDQLAAQAQAASDRAQNIQQEMMPIPQAPQASPLEGMMQQHIQKQLQDELSRGNSKAEKFDRGFELGQRIASSVVVPLMGVMGKGPGSAAGANAAVQDINQQLGISKAQRAQEKAQHNNTIATLSQMAETMDPKSMKNITALLAKQIEVQKYNRQLQQDAIADHGKALSNLAGVQEKTIGFDAAARKDAIGAALQSEGHALEAAKMGNDALKFGATEKDKALQRALQERGLTNSENNLALQKQEYKTRIDNAKTDNERKDSAAQLSALTELERSMRLNKQNMDATTASGAKKYASYGEFLNQNPLTKQIFSRLAEKAGIKNADPDKLFATLDAPPAQTGGGFDLGGMMNSLGNGIKSLMPSSAPPANKETPAAAPKEVPAKLKSVAEQRGFKKVNGKWVKN